MQDWDIEQLAKEIARVCTVGLGRPLRKDAQTDQLRLIAESLATEPEPHRWPFLLYEKALQPSIDRLERGPMGRLARIEFGLTPESKKMPLLKERRQLAKEEVGNRGDSLKSLERKMHTAIAEDLVARFEAISPPAPLAVSSPEQDKSTAPEDGAGARFSRNEGYF